MGVRHFLTLALTRSSSRVRMLRLSVSAPLVQLLILYRLTRMGPDYKFTGWKALRDVSISQNKCLYYFMQTYGTLNLNR